ncbi:MAG: DNA primase [Candidatus Cloacimonetes bacterium]|nr:DNA primase [Candidatus Cloacimonadota bacterium]
MADEVQEIKDKLDIVEFINSYAPLKKTGRNFRALCPFHSERTPSFFVSPERQTWHCFGCNRGGDIYSFLMEKEGLTFGEALRMLASRAGVELKTRFSPQRQERKERLLAATHLASEFYHYLLAKHKLGEKTRQYLSNRSIERTSIEEFKLGYAPSSWEAAGKFLLSRGFKVDELLETGLIIEKSDIRHPTSDIRHWYDRFRGRLMFPVFDVTNRVVGFSARTLENEEPKYINSPESAIFKKGHLLYGLNLAKDEIRAKDTTILVEGNLDVISAHQAGFQNVVAPLGTGVTEAHAKLSKRFAQKISICFDNDEAGTQATLRAIPIAQSQGLEISVLQIKNAQDADELIRQDPQLFEKALSETRTAFFYLLSLGKGKFNATDTALSKKKIAALVLPFIARTPKEIEKDALVKKLAEELGISERAVWSDLEKTSGLENQRISELEEGENKKAETPKKSREILLAEHLLQLILASEKTVWVDEKFKTILSNIQKDFFVSDKLTEIWQSVEKFFNQKREINVKEIGKNLSPSSQAVYDLLILRPAAKIYEKEQEFLNDLQLAADELKKLFLRKKLQELSLAIREAEKKEAREEVDRLKKEFKETLGEMPK